MDKNIQEFVNHSDFTTYVFTTKRKSDDRWVLSSKEGGQRFYIKLHASEIKIKDGIKHNCYTIPISGINRYLYLPFFMTMSIPLKRKIYQIHNDHIFNVNIPSAFKSNDISICQYSEHTGEIRGSVVEYRDIVFEASGKQGICRRIIPAEIFEEMLMRRWENLTELQQCAIGYHLDYNQDVRYNLFVENMLLHPVLLKLKELYADNTLVQSVYGVDDFVQIKFSNSKKISDVIFSVSSEKDGYVSINEFTDGCCTTSYNLEMPRNIWVYLINRIYWMNEMFNALGILEHLKMKQQ